VGGVYIFQIEDSFSLHLLDSDARVVDDIKVSKRHASVGERDAFSQAAGETGGRQ
jgi:hypothetical protein